MHNSIKLFFVLFLCLFPSLAFSGEVTYYHTDNVGTPVAMSNALGAVVWKGDFLPFGEENQIINTPNRNKRHFIGKEKDKESGLHYFGARYMDEGSGRFVSPDPITAVNPQTGEINHEILANPLRLNRYVYGLNNPYKYVDPDGNWAEAVLVEGPSIAIGVNSLGHNIKQGNVGAALLDAVGIIADSAAVLAPGIPGGVGLGIKASRVGRYINAPKEIKGIPGLTRAKSKTPVQGGGGLRKRWKSKKGSIYEWDSQHGTLEKYNKHGKHQGEFDHLTGKQTKPANNNRKIEP